MAYYHGIKTKETATSVSTPAEIQSGITFAVGTAPVYMGEGSINKPIFAGSYKEAVAALGYSDDFENFTLCEVMKTHFGLYGVSPVIFVNVFDPQKHCTAAGGKEHIFVDGVIELPDSAIADTVVVKDTADGVAYVKDKDYIVHYTDGNLIVEKTDDGDIGSSTVYIEYSRADISKVKPDDIIGGINVDDGSKSGLELIGSVYPKYGVIPEIIIAPGFSSDSAVAAIMAAKAEGINELFKGMAVIDADSSVIRKYSDVYEWKSRNNISNTNQIVCWPMVALGGVKYHMSTHIAALMSSVDNDNSGIPSEPPSNKTLRADSTVLSDGSEVVLELSEANLLNSKGIAAAINHGGRFVLWGNETACYPASADVKDYFINVNRMFGYVSKSVILTYWSRIDSKMTRRLIDSIVDSINIWLNGLKTSEHILGGRIEFDADENPVTDLMAGKMKFHIYMTPPSPAKEIEFTLEYDAEYVSAALGG